MSPVQRSLSKAPFLFALFLFGGLLAAFFRVVWTFSLANGDEFFFSTLKGRTIPGQYSFTEFTEFLRFLWVEHTGRSADWLSTAVYFFGLDTGLWIVSFLTSFSVCLIAYSVYRFLRFYAPKKPHFLMAATAIVCAVFAVFTPAYMHTNYVSNLLLYSAAVCNYLVVVALLVYVWALTSVSNRRKDWFLASVLVFLAGTTHEQAAVAVISLVGLTLISRWKHTPRKRLFFYTFSGLCGAAIMLLSPGLHNKLAVASTSVTATDNMLAKIKFSLRALQIQYQNLVVSLFIMGVAGLILIYLNRQSAPKLRQTIVPLLTLTAVTVATLSIPLASGVGQIRVFHYPILLGGVAASIAFCLGAASLRPGKKKLTYFLPLFLTLLTLTGYAVLGAHNTFASQYYNYPAGRAQLLEQIKNCSQPVCLVTDPQNLPVKFAFSGYGEHDYVNTRNLQLWLDLQ